MVKNTDHCRLCQNHEPNIKLGLICTLTQKPPEFYKTCNKIDFDKIALERIKEIDLRFKKMTASKFDVYGGIIFWPSIGILVLVGNYLLSRYLAVNGVISSVTYILFCVGIILIAMGTGPFLEFKKEKEVITSNKNNLDKVLKNYRLKYNVVYYPKRNFLDTRIMVKNIELINTHPHLK